MSYASDRGYRGERPVELWLGDQGHSVLRPRAGQPQDVGDIVGLPLVISVKNHRALKLADWIDDLTDMVSHTQSVTGVVIHKRRLRASPNDWYVTTTGRLFLPLLQSYLETRR